MKPTDKRPDTIEICGKRMQLMGFIPKPPNVQLALKDRTLCLAFWPDLRADAKPFLWPPIALEIGDRDAHDRDNTTGWRSVYPTHTGISPKTNRKQTVTPRYWCKVSASFPEKPNQKEKAKPRGKDGGRKPSDGQDAIARAVNKVLELRKYNKSKSMTMERACANVIKALTLTIKWPALAKQVRRSRGWKPLKKLIKNARE